MKRFGGFDAFRLKIIMLLPMISDHLYYYIFTDELLPVHYITRVVAPVFVFIMSQGMVYTRDRRRYILRLCGFGIIMAFGNITVSALTRVRIPSNIFLSLAVGAAIIYCIDRLLEDRSNPLWPVLIAVLAYTSLFCEGEFQIPLAAVIFYYLRGNRPAMYLAYILMSGLPHFLLYLGSGRMSMQFFMIFAVLPIMTYNGERGYNTAFAKYFFYIIYPLHIWIIVFIKYFFFTA